MSRSTLPELQSLDIAERHGVTGLIIAGAQPAVGQQAMIDGARVEITECWAEGQHWGVLFSVMQEPAE